MIHTTKKYYFSVLLMASTLTSCQSVIPLDLGTEIISDLNPAGEDPARAFAATEVLLEGKPSENVDVISKKAVK